MKTKYWIIISYLFGLAIALWGIVALIIISHFAQTAPIQASVPTATTYIATVKNISIGEEEMVCPSSNVSYGFTSEKCYLIDSSYNAYGILSFKSDGDLGAIGVFYYYYAPSRVTDKLATFIIDVANAYGWETYDVNKLANELPLTAQGNVLTSGDIYGSYATTDHTIVEVFRHK